MQVHTQPAAVRLQGHDCQKPKTVADFALAAFDLVDAGQGPMGKTRLTVLAFRPDAPCRLQEGIEMTEEVVRGKSGAVRFNAERCIHSRNCVLDRPDVFVPNVEGEWIHPERATPGELASLARNCPSGAIQYEPPDGSTGEFAPSVNTARIYENGPLSFHAQLAIGNDSVPDRLRATLCRCGASAHKPFCDRSHVASGFVASGEVVAIDSSSSARRDGLVTDRPGRKRAAPCDREP